jgi:hypothetical protein
MRNSVLASYARYTDAQRARHDLIVSGFSSAEVAVASQEELLSPDDGDKYSPWLEQLRCQARARLTGRLPGPAPLPDRQAYWLILDADDDTLVARAETVLSAAGATEIERTTLQ